jgi:putative ABC transport system permease protein
MPLGAYARLFGARSRSISLLARPREGLAMSPGEAEETARFGMRLQRRLRYGEVENFSVTTAKSIQAFAGRITALVSFVLYPLTSIALLVGGIVVMNMMLASVTERTREIGIRLAIGARRKDILAQFLIESALLTLVGGLLGLIAAAALVRIGAVLTDLPLGVPGWALAAALLVSTAVGVGFGVVPARRASRLDPIEALRKE